MSSIYKKLIDGSFVPASTGVGFTATNTTVIQKLTFTNIHTSSVEVTVYLVPSGESASLLHLVTNQKEVAAEDSWNCHHAEGHVLETGDSIRYFCNTAEKLTAVSSGVELA